MVSSKRVASLYIAQTKEASEFIVQFLKWYDGWAKKGKPPLVKPEDPEQVKQVDTVIMEKVKKLPPYLQDLYKDPMYQSAIEKYLEDPEHTKPVSQVY